MELAYLWIENYKVLSNQEFNFGAKYYFSLKNKTITYSENASHIPNFYNIGSGKANITNITAVIGQNGAGKTTLFEFIRKYVLGSEIPQKKFIAVYISGDHIFVKGNRLEEYLFNFKYSQIENSMRKNKTVFISTVYDRKTEEQIPHELNLSTNFLLQKNSYESTKIQYDINLLDVFSKNKEELSLNIDLRFPDNLEVALIDNLMDSKFFYEYSEQINKINNILLIKEISKEKTLYRQLLFTVFNGFLRYISRQKKLHYNDKIRSDKELNFLLNDLIVDLAKKIDPLNADDTFLLTLRDMSARSDNYKSYKKNIKNIVVFLEYVGNLLGEGKYIDINESRDDRFTLIGQNKIIEFINYYSRSNFKKDFLEFNWAVLSSGEECIIDIFSRLYQVVKTNNGSQQLNVYLLIDEIENNLHPQWQKQILEDMIRFIRKFYSNWNVQIILTSHSPFMISDLPHYNVILMEKLINGEIVNGTLENHELTFASNIHTVLAHSFFMKNGTMGQFATNKVNSLYKQILNKPISELIFQREEFERLINIISEPILRHKLMNTLEERLKFNVYDEINLLKEEILKLKRLNNNND
ncbi:AAA family ATPase [Lysinibacillus capsici]|uniref:AAA family ATPase n=1 Tax=Lysinibacillus capsici TaxID=2115968 RepID=UPI0034E45F52